MCYTKQKLKFIHKKYCNYKFSLKKDIFDDAINFSFIKFSLNTMSSFFFKPKLQQTPYLYMLHEIVGCFHKMSFAKFYLSKYFIGNVTAETMSNCWGFDKGTHPYALSQCFKWCLKGSIWMAEIISTNTSHRQLTRIILCMLLGRALAIHCNASTGNG